MAVLNGWQEISDYLRRGVRTAQRWESYGLPVRRPSRQNRSAVIAITEDIDAWMPNTGILVTTPDLGTTDLRHRADRALEQHRSLVSTTRKLAHELDRLKKSLESIEFPVLDALLSNHAGKQSSDQRSGKE